MGLEYSVCLYRIGAMAGVAVIACPSGSRCGGMPGIRSTLPGTL